MHGWHVSDVPLRLHLLVIKGIGSQGIYVMGTLSLVAERRGALRCGKNGISSDDPRPTATDCRHYKVINFPVYPKF